MPMPPRKRKPADDFALLLEPEEDPAEEMGEGEFEEDFSEDDPFAEEMPAEEDPLAAEASSVDPEQAALAEQLGFTEPEQQQALIDLIKLVSAPAPDMGPMEGY